MTRAFLFFTGLFTLGLIVFFFAPLEATVTFAVPPHAGIEIPLLFFIAFLLLLTVILFYPFYQLKRLRSSDHLFLKELILGVNIKSANDAALFKRLSKHRNIRAFASFHLFQIAEKNNQTEEALALLEHLKDYPFYRAKKAELLLSLGQIEKAYKTCPTYLPAVLSFYPISSSPWKVLLDSYLDEMHAEVADSIVLVYPSFPSRIQKKTVQKIHQKYPNDPLAEKLSKMSSKDTSKLFENTSFME